VSVNSDYFTVLDVGGEISKFNFKDMFDSDFDPKTHKDQSHKWLQPFPTKLLAREIPLSMT